MQSKVEEIITAFIPNYTAFNQKSSPFTAPSLGYVRFVGKIVQNDYTVGKINGKTVVRLGSGVYQADECAGAPFLVKKGDTVTVTKGEIYWQPVSIQ